MNNFRDLKIQEEKLRKGIEIFDNQKRNDILDALNMGKKAHSSQKRDEGDPYIIHPIRIANTLIYDLVVKDEKIIITALLHDVVEDTDIRVSEIEKRFGERVALLVSALTRNKEKETKQEKFEKILRGAQEERLLKACDWLDNLRSFVYRSDRGERWQRHLIEARDMYVPLARAVGNKWLITEMQKAYDQAVRSER